MAPSMATFARPRSPPKPSSASPVYRSTVRETRCSASSFDIAARIRGSSCAASATTSTCPGSATTARRSDRGICSAPPPRLAQRPDTTPPGTNSLRNRPSRTHSASQVQPFAECNRASSLYSSSGATAGWSMSLTTSARVVSMSKPTRRNAARTSTAESGFTAKPKARSRRAARSASARGRVPGGTGGPSAAPRISRCTSARQGSPALVISSAARPDADSAATRRASAGSSPIRRSWSTYDARRSARPGASARASPSGAAGSNSAG